MIPTQLKEMGFCRVLKGDKIPSETAWQNKPYSYEQILNYFPQENYGVLTGHNDLGVLDDDSLKSGFKEPILLRKFLSNFPKTFRVRDHLYVILKGWDQKKITFYHESGKKIGELQGLGQHVVGAGSLHPSGEAYDVKEDLPILEIEYGEFERVFKPFIKHKQQVVREFKRTEWRGDKIQDIPIASIISFSGKDMGNGCYQGSHPYHGSTNGMNFRLDTRHNLWKCFRDDHGGGGAAELIAVMEGIIDCKDAGSNCFTEDQGQQVINIARKKYGLKNPTDDMKPLGWANSVSILKMAERHKFTVCPKCHNSFNFNDKLGWFKCKCSRGGLKQFANLIMGGAT